nr:hypothetical protein CFP56_65883 [Quercus suber]
MRSKDDCDRSLLMRQAFCRGNTFCDVWCITTDLSVPYRRVALRKRMKKADPRGTENKALRSQCRNPQGVHMGEAAGHRN